MRVDFTAGSCLVRREATDVAYAPTEYGEQRFLRALLATLDALRSVDGAAGLVVRKATSVEAATIDASLGLFRRHATPGQIWAIYYETGRGGTAGGRFTTEGRVRLAVARVPRRKRRCRRP